MRRVRFIDSDTYEYDNVGRLVQIPSLDVLESTDINIPRLSVHYRTTGNVNIASPPGTVDSSIPGYLELIGAFNQTIASENGLYRLTCTSPRTWTKLVSLDALIAATSNIQLTVTNGTVHAGKTYLLNKGVIGSSDIGTPSDSGIYVKNVEDYYLAADGNDWSPAFQRAIDAIYENGIVRCQRRRYYDCYSRINVEKLVYLVGISYVYTIIRFHGCAGFKLRAPSNTAPGNGSAGGTILENLRIRYIGTQSEALGWTSANAIVDAGTDSNTRHGIEASIRFTAKHVLVEGFPGHNWDLGATSALGENVNESFFLECNSYYAGLSGIYTYGTDSNASTFVHFGSFASGNQKLDDGWDIWDNSLVGNFWFGYNANSGWRGCVRATNDTGVATFIGYDEAGAGGEGRSLITPPNIAINGTTTNIFGLCSLMVLTGGAVANAVWFSTYPRQAGTYFIEITTGGGLGVAQFKWDKDGVTTTGVTVAASVVLGSTGLTATFVSRTYAVGERYSWTATLYGPGPGLGSGVDSGTTRGGDTTFWTRGPKNTRIRLGRQQTNEILQLLSDDDSGWRMILHNTIKGWVLNHSNSDAAIGMTLTTAGHARGVGHVKANRGLLSSSAEIRVGYGTLAARPTTCGDPATPGSDVWLVGDRWYNSAPSSGNPDFWYVSAVAGGAYPRALTWTASANLP